MSESVIGIKIANGEFYPILEEGKPGKKRLILTTVNDNQESVQIDLYKGLGENIEDASYVGSLFIENIEPEENGIPDIELIVGIDSDGNLNAEAGYNKKDEKQSLSVSLNAIPDVYDSADFAITGDGDVFDEDFGSEDLSASDGGEDFGESGDGESDDFNMDFDGSGEDDFSFDDDFSGDQEDDFEDGSVSDSDPDSFTEIRETSHGEITSEEKSRLTVKTREKKEKEPESDSEEKKKGPLGVIILLALLALAIFLLVYFLVLRSPGEESGEGSPDQPVAQQTETLPPAPVITPPAEVPKTETPAPVQEPPKSEGVWYLIKKGDTLWDLSNAFYRTPWQYGRIAKANNIANPDRIYWGFRIFIPGE